MEWDKKRYKLEERERTLDRKERGGERYMDREDRTAERDSKEPGDGEVQYFDGKFEKSKRTAACHVIYATSEGDDEEFSATSSVSGMHVSRKRGSARFPVDACPKWQVFMRLSCTTHDFEGDEGGLLKLLVSACSARWVITSGCIGHTPSRSVRMSNTVEVRLSFVIGSAMFS